MSINCSVLSDPARLSNLNTQGQQSLGSLWGVVKNALLTCRWNSGNMGTEGELYVDARYSLPRLAADSREGFRFVVVMLVDRRDRFRVRTLPNDAGDAGDFARDMDRTRDMDRARDMDRTRDFVGNLERDFVRNLCVLVRRARADLFNVNLPMIVPLYYRLIYCHCYAQVSCSIVCWESRNVRAITLFDALLSNGLRSIKRIIRLALSSCFL